MTEATIEYDVINSKGGYLLLRVKDADWTEKYWIQRPDRGRLDGPWRLDQATARLDLLASGGE